MLKKIPPCISPELMKTMMQMGHGDELILADADFPADTFGKRVIRADGVKTIGLLSAILEFYPLDPFVKYPAAVMGPEDNPGIKELLKQAETAIRLQEPGFKCFEFVERFAFYERAAKAFAVVITGQEDGNIILKKGVVNI